MQVVNGIDERSWVYESDTSALKFLNPDRPIRIRIWLIVNQKLLPEHEVVRSRWTSIAARSLNVLLRTSMLQTIQDLETYIQLINQHPKFDAQFRYVAIPQDFQIEEAHAMFDANKMREISALGRKMGADPKSWKPKALRPGAPF